MMYSVPWANQSIGVPVVNLVYNSFGTSRKRHLNSPYSHLIVHLHSLVDRRGIRMGLFVGVH